MRVGAAALALVTIAAFAATATATVDPEVHCIWVEPPGDWWCGPIPECVAYWWNEQAFRRCCEGPEGEICFFP